MTSALVDERMSDVHALVWAVERTPRFRTTIAALARFDVRLDTAELRHRVERASRVVPRLRQRVIHDPLGIAAPRWSIDPNFRLSFHLRRIQLSQGDDARLLQVARDLIVQPFDRAHPLWEFTLIEGLDGGGSALLLKSHHSISDGVGGAEMMLELFDLQSAPDAERENLPAAPTASPARPDALSDAVRHEAGRAIGAAKRSLDSVITHRSLDEVIGHAQRLGESLGSAFRMYRPAGPTHAVPSARSAGLDLRTLSIPLEDLRAAGDRVGGTINDAFVAAVAIGTTDHHRNRATRESSGLLRISVPINRRTGGDGAGNHWTPGRIELDLRPDAEPDRVAEQVRRKMSDLRKEPAHELLGPLAAGIRRLPPSAVASLVESMSSGVDLAASNVPGSPTPLYLCGQEVIELVPFGPLSGCAINVTLMSHAGVAHVGVSSDPAAVPDPDGRARDLRAAFTSVVKGS